MPPGSLVVLPIDGSPEPVLAMHLPDGNGFMFAFQVLNDPDAESLADPNNLWPWADGSAPDGGPEVLVLARDLDWPAVHRLLGLVDADEQVAIRDVFAGSAPSETPAVRHFVPFATSDDAAFVRPFRIRRGSPLAVVQMEVRAAASLGGLTEVRARLGDERVLVLQLGRTDLDALMERLAAARTWCADREVGR